MRYSVAEIEDQILATLTADTVNFTGVNLKTFAGQINPQMFFNPEYMQGAVQLLPFTLISYQGRSSKKASFSADGKVRIHKLKFRIYNGAQSRRSSKEAARNAYDMIAACYDDLQAKAIVISSQNLPGFTPLSGTALTSSGANPQTPLYSADGDDEGLIVNLPTIVVYASDFWVELVA